MSHGVLPKLGGVLTTDVDDIKYVINFDFPNCSEDYVHRIGRTGRSNKSGTAYTFFTENNIKQAGDLIAVLNEANQAINPKLMEMAEMPRSFGSSKGRNSGKWKQSMTRFNRNGYKQNDSMRTRSSGPRDLSQNRGSNIRFNSSALNAGGSFYNRSINSQPLSQSNIPNNPVNRQTGVQGGFGQFGSVNNSWFSNRA